MPFLRLRHHLAPGLLAFWLALLAHVLPGVAEDSSKPPAANADLSSDVLNVGDKIRVTFGDITDPPAPLDTQIPESGSVTLHLGHKFNFRGERRDLLEQKIRDYYITNGLYKIITVSIEVPARPITVGGEVRSPNTYPHPGRLSILKAIDLAGGFTEFADRRKVRIIRNSRPIIVNCKKALDDPSKHDVEVFPGDKIQVDRRGLLPF
ncbi:MAG: SLBB domain-containing protein [Verrucomicrobiota bacterium]|jgi:polysaccharide export outer membrane protein